jgi:hypothetical protein
MFQHGGRISQLIQAVIRKINLNLYLSRQAGEIFGQRFNFAAAPGF